MSTQKNKLELRAQIRIYQEIIKHGYCFTHHIECIRCTHYKTQALCSDFSLQKDMIEWANTELKKYTTEELLEGLL